LLPINLRLLRLQTSLYFSILLLPRLHLIADQRPAEKSNGSADTRARAGVAGGAADDRAQASTANGSDRSAFFSGRKRFRTADQQDRQ
jgi:hypothetical protein